MKKISGKMFAVLAAGITVAVICTGCAKKTAEKKLSLNVGKFTSNSMLNPLIEIAMSRGYYDEYGLDVNVNNVDRSGAFESLSIGKIDVTYSEIIPELSYGAQGSDVTIFAGTLSGGMAVMANKTVAEEVRDIHNWKNKTIGVKLLSTSEMISKNVLQTQYGFKIDEDVKYKFFDGDESLLAATTKGAVDVAFVSSNYVDSATAQGAVYLFPETTLKKDYVCCRHTANGTNLQKNRDAYVALLKGEIRAYKDYLTDEKGAVAAVVKSSGQTEDYVKRYIYDKETSQNTSYNPDPNYNGVEGVYSVLLGWNYVKSQRPLNEFFDISVYADALKAVIKQFPDDTFYRNMWGYFTANNNLYPDFSEKYQTAL